MNQFIEQIGEKASDVQDWLLSNPKTAIFGASTVAAGLLIYANGAENRDEKEMPRMSGYKPILGHAKWLSDNFDTLFDSLGQEFIDYINKKNNGEPIPLLATVTPGRCHVWVIDPQFVQIAYRKHLQVLKKVNHKWK